MKQKVTVTAIAMLALAAVIAFPLKSQSQNTTFVPPPPPGALGGSFVGLDSTLTTMFNNGFDLFETKWDPGGLAGEAGLGPVFTQPQCNACHGGQLNRTENCQFQPPGVGCTPGGTSTILGTRYGKFNPDGTFNYLDGNGTVPENEGGPVNHGQSVAGFETLGFCRNVSISASPNGAKEVGTTVTIQTTIAHDMTVGQRVQVFNVGVAGYDGIFVVTSIPNSVQYTYTDTVTGLANSGGGTSSPMPIEVVPSDATVNSQIRSPELYGFGLIDNIPDSTILANSGVNKGLGITGFANMVPDHTGAIRPGRFAQKLNFVSLEDFIASAFFNEIGMTNAFNPINHLPQGQPYPAACEPDTNNPRDVNGLNFLGVYQYEELLAPVTPQPPTTQTEAGKVVFESIGCNLCHIETMQTGPNVQLVTDLNGDLSEVVPQLSNQTVNLYSDLLLHDMGPTSSGGLPFLPNNQGQATLTEWRTAPLWGLSTRIVNGLMHSNKAKTVGAAILAHGGEASQVVANYKALSSTDQSNLIAFLSSL